MTIHRVFDHQRIWQLDQYAFDHATQLLAEAATARFGPVNAVVGIARGGLALAEALATYLQVPAATVTARHNATDRAYQPATGTVTVDRTAEPPAGKVLLADDIVGSGATLEAVQTALHADLHADSDNAVVGTVTLCRNAAADPPDLWVWTVRDWVWFPWEPQPHTGEPIRLLPCPTKVRHR